MGILRWLWKKTYPPAMVADNAIKQYQKAKYRNMGNSPKEIAVLLWQRRYILNRPLDSKSEPRLHHYIQSGFPIETVLDFCLSSLDIEFLFGPPDLDTYEYAADYIGKELARNNIPCTTSDVSSFIDKWNRLISPLR